MIDELWHGGPRFMRGGSAFALGTDSVLLASFAGEGTAKTACDLGCGSGIISVLLAWNSPELIVDGIELQDSPAKLAGLNAELCGLSSRIRITRGDLREYREYYDAGAYDLVVSNPPYFAEGRGKPASGDDAAARDERTCTIRDVCEAAAYLTRWGGRFALVHRPERLAEVFSAMSENGLEPKRLRFVQHREGAAPNLALIEARRGGKPHLTVEAPLIMTDADGGDSEEIKAIYHRGSV